MNNECPRTRRLLLRYLRGHMFLFTRRRIDRHLAGCPVCRSEFEALKRVQETKLLLRDLHASEDVLGRMKQGARHIGKVRILFYRPLWIAGLVLVAGAIAYYAALPRQLDLDIDRIMQSSPTPTQATAPDVKSAPAAPAGEGSDVHPPAPSAAVEPFVAVITPENDKAAVRRINEVMRGHAKLRALKFSEAVRDASCSLTAKELLTFFSRIENVASIKYSRKQLDAYPAGAIPVVLKLKPALHAVERPDPLPSPVAPAQQKPAAADAPPVEGAAPPTQSETAASSSATFSR